MNKPPIQTNNILTSQTVQVLKAPTISVVHLRVLKD